MHRDCIQFTCLPKVVAVCPLDNLVDWEKAVCPLGLVKLMELDSSVD